MAGSKLIPVKEPHVWNLTNVNVEQKHGGRHIAEEDCDTRDLRYDPGDKTWSKIVVIQDSEVAIKQVTLSYNNPN